MERILDLLQKLNIVTSQSNYNFFRRSPASFEQIEHFEKKLGIKLTTDLIAFYQMYNGGFISLGDRTFLEVEHPEDFDDAEWVSNVFLSLDEIVAAYFQEKGSYGFANIRQFEKNNQRLIPIMITNNQEYYLLNISKGDQIKILKLSINPSDDDNNYFLESSIYQQFEDLLESYIITEGRTE